jgi:ankyrin repeat protein
MPGSRRHSLSTVFGLALTSLAASLTATAGASGRARSAAPAGQVLRYAALTRPSRTEGVFGTGFGPPPATLALSPNGTVLAAGWPNGVIRLWSVHSGALRQAVVAAAPLVAVSPDGKQLVTCGDNKTAQLRDLLSGQVQRTLKNEVAPEGFAFAPDGTTLACGASDESITLWDCRTGRRRWVSRGHTGWMGGIGLLAFSPDGSLLASAGGSGFMGAQLVELWDARSGELQEEVETGTVVSAIAFSPDGKTLALGSERTGAIPSVELWDVRDKRLRITLNHQNGFVVAVAFSRDGRTLVSADTEGRINWWDLRTGRIIRSVGEDRGCLWQVAAVSADARKAAVPDDHGTLYVYDDNSAAPVHRRQPAREAGPKKSPNEALRQALWSPGMFGDKATDDQVAREVKTQLAAGADPNTRSRDGTTALMFLAFHGDLAAVQDLLRRGAAINSQDRCAMTALLYAARGGQTAVLQFLLDSGAGLNDAAGRSLIIGASRQELGTALLALLEPQEKSLPYASPSVVDTALVLLHLGADPSVRDERGRTPLFFADDPRLMEELLSRGADAGSADKYGQTPTIIWSMHARTDLVKLLLDHDANVNAAQQGGSTALLFAAQNGRDDLAQLLLSRGANPNQAAKDGRTPLMLAASGGHLEIVRRLIDKGADVRARAGDEGWTALAYAAIRGDAAVTRLLLDKGATLDLPTVWGKSFFVHLRRLDPTDRFGIAALLKKAGARE